MKKVNRVLAVLILLVILAGIIVALHFRRDISMIPWSDDTIEKFLVEKIDMEAEMKEMGESNGSQDVFYLTASDLEQKSSILVLASPTGKREIFQESILTELEISNIFKNENNRPIQDHILVFEPIAVNLWGKVLSLKSPLNLMLRGKEYILCLNFYGKPEDYHLKDIEQSMYLLSNPYTGIIPLEDPPSNVYLHTGDTKPSYHEIMDYAYVFSNDSEEAFYLTLRENFIKLIADLSPRDPLSVRGQE